ncbi:hypothetical protein J3F84DRAFT_379705 [Trichoderma pleuroticola]
MTYYNTDLCRTRAALCDSQFAKMALSRSQLISTANAFIAAYNQWTVSGVLSIQSSSCTHRVLPGNRRARTRAEFGEFLERTIPVIRNFRLHVVDTSPWIVDVETRRVTMHLKSTGSRILGRTITSTFL